MKVMPARKVVLAVLLASLLFPLCMGSASAQAPGSVVPLAGLSPTQSDGAYDLTLKKLHFEMGYGLAEGAPTELTAGLDKFQFLAKKVSDEETRTLLIGLKHYPTQDDQIILSGEVAKADQTSAPNPDIETVTALIGEAIKVQTETQRKFKAHELEQKIYQLSNVEAAPCIADLAALGYKTGTPGPELALADLPFVYRLGETAGPVALIGSGAAFGGPTHSGPMNRLLILFHSTQREQALALENVIRETIDVPARQVLIEAMFIELSEGASREIGVKYDWKDHEGRLQATFEGLVKGEVSPLKVLYLHPTSTSVDVFNATLKALIDEDKAEILSSPSVLTLDNRQAKITVAEKVPLLLSVLTETTTAVNVRYESVGITLNIKPRISDDSSSVAMQIQAEVSEAPEEDYLFFSASAGQEPQKIAPRIFSRNVNTVANVLDNTPFIIGGLIRNEKAKVVSRIPVLSSIPLLGNLFKFRSDRTEKRGVIIVLTPRVIPLEGGNRPVLPKDDERFDLFDTELFRDAYRLKADDVFDLGFITDNEMIQRTLRRAREYCTLHPECAARPPFDKVQEGMIPGEEAIVVRMLYEIVKNKLKAHERIDVGDLIFFEEALDEPAGFKVRFLDTTIKKLFGMKPKAYFKRDEYPRDVLVLHYRIERDSQLRNIITAPVAKVEIITLQNKDDAEQKMIECNSLEGYLRDKTSFILDGERDLDRLKVAIVVREIVNVNSAILQVSKFQVGRRIAIPEVLREDDRIFLVDHTVSQYFYLSDFYYAAFRNTLETYFDGILEVLSRPIP